ncbi:MAG TPA: NnrU family protein [Acetobacteraceae bacterium]|nr:NnrU family protein [Acetobacteraceae bacterium]
MGLLFVAAAIWIAAHVGIAGSAVRARIVGRIGDAWFRGVFSLLSLASIVFLCVAYRRAPLLALWSLPAWLVWILDVLMLPACVLLIAAVAAPNPTSVGQDKAMAREPAGVTRVTRHPMLWSFTIWALVHLLANGELGGVIFFGAFAVTSLVGMPSIDRKLAARDPVGWARLSAVTSILPFGAIAAGRNRFVPAEIVWYVPAGGFVLWAALLYFHATIVGVPAIPG